MKIFSIRTMECISSTALFGLLAAIAFVYPVNAEFYKYSDRHGNIIYTDDLSNVPVDQRLNAKIYETTDQVPPPGLSNVESDNISEGRQIDQDRHLVNERKQLEAIKENLDKEFKSLVEENARIKEEQKTAVTPKQVKYVNKKAVRFNTRFQAYQEKEAAYKTRLEAYNKRLSSTNIRK